MRKSVRVLAALSALLCGTASAALIHQYNAANMAGTFTFSDSVGGVALLGKNTTGGSAAGVTGTATTVKTTFTKALSAGAANTGFTRSALAASTTYTLEMWTRLSGGTTPTANSVLWETGSSVNGFGVFTASNGTIQFGSYSGSGANNNVISLSTASLDLSDYLQITAVYDISINQIKLQVKDVNGVTVSGTDSSGALTTGTGNMLGLFLPSSVANTMATGMSNAGGAAATTFGAAVTATQYGGQIALFNIYNNDALNTDVLASYNTTVIPEPSTISLLVISSIGVLLVRRYRTA